MKTARKLLTPAIIILLVTAFLVPHGNAALFQTQPEITTIKFPGYELNLPIRIVIGFTYTQNYSINVRTFGQSDHHEISSPTKIEFRAEQADIYQLFVDVRYDVTVNQTITIGLYEGNKTIKPIEIDMANNGFHIEMTITAVEPPTFPTAEEISELIYTKWRNELSAFETYLNNAMNNMSSALAISVGFGIIAFFVVLAIAFWLFRIHSRLAKLEAHGIRKEP